MKVDAFLFIHLSESVHAFFRVVGVIPKFNLKKIEVSNNKERTSKIATTVPLW